jgi:uncharacterized protein (DUF433 family)
MPALLNHVRVDADGTAWVDATSYKVLHLVQEALAYGWSPEEIAYQHYGELSLAQVHAALSFYYDNRAELDTVLDREFEEYQRLRGAEADLTATQTAPSAGALAMSLAQFHRPSTFSITSAYARK